MISYYIGNWVNCANGLVADRLVLFVRFVRILFTWVLFNSIFANSALCDVPSTVIIGIPSNKNNGNVNVDAARFQEWAVTENLATIRKIESEQSLKEFTIRTSANTRQAVLEEIELAIRTWNGLEQDEVINSGSYFVPLSLSNPYTKSQIALHRIQEPLSQDVASVLDQNIQRVFEKLALAAATAEDAYKYSRLATNTDDFVVVVDNIKQFVIQNKHLSMPEAQLDREKLLTTISIQAAHLKDVAEVQREYVAEEVNQEKVRLIAESKEQEKKGGLALMYSKRLKELNLAVEKSDKVFSIAEQIVVSSAFLKDVSQGEVTINQITKQVKSPVTVNHFELPVDKFESFKNVFPESQIIPVDVPMVITIEDLSLRVSESHLNGDESNKLRSLLSKPRYQKPVLIVLDDSWPSSKSYCEARSFLVSGLRKIWEINRWGKRGFSLALPDFQENQCKLFDPKGLTCKRPGMCGAHAAKIEESIEEYRQLFPENNQPVQVIFLPFTVSHSEAKELLKPLLQIYYLSTTNVEPILSQEELDSFVSRTLSRLPGVMQANGVDLPSAISLFHAVIAFTGLYSSIYQQPVFLNLSWSTLDLNYNFSEPGAGFNFIIAAAGNHCDPATCNGDVTQVQPQRQFALRSAFQKDYLAVMNVDRLGNPICKSSLMPYDSFSLGFDGTLQSGDCGTSFSAPRVAWLLAASEAVTQKDESMGNAKYKEWFQYISKKVNLIRDECKQVGNFDCLRMRIDRLK